MLLETLAKIQLLLIDDWLRNPLAKSQIPDLLEILEDRYSGASTMLATQIPVSDWHDRLGNTTLSDAVMDRIIRNACRLELRGESMRNQGHDLIHDLDNISKLFYDAFRNRGAVSRLCKYCVNKGK